MHYSLFQPSTARAIDGICPVLNFRFKSVGASNFYLKVAFPPLHTTRAPCFADWDSAPDPTRYFNRVAPMLSRRAPLEITIQSGLRRRDLKPPPHQPLPDIVVLLRSPSTSCLPRNKWCPCCASTQIVMRTSYGARHRRCALPRPSNVRRVVRCKGGLLNFCTCVW